MIGTDGGTRDIKAITIYATTIYAMSIYAITICC